MLFGIVLLLFLPSHALASSWAWLDQLTQSATYQGDTPYKNIPVNSVNVTTAMQIQRDIAMNITVDQIVWPAIDLSTAYFGQDYSTQRLARVDTLLKMGYRRLVVDIYWDPLLLDWQLCPLQVVGNATQDVTLANGYVCSTDYKFTQFLQTVNDYLVSTEVTRAPKKTDIVFLVLNLHELNITANKTTSTATDSNLGQIIQSAISDTTTLVPRIYTPLNLTMDRVNTTAAISGSLSKGSNGSLSSIHKRQIAPNAWPHWLYLIEQKVQLIVGFGTVPSGGGESFRLSMYDKNVIFDAQSIGGFMNTTNTGCFNNASWAFVSDRQKAYNYTTALQLATCGYSPYFTHSNYSDGASSYSPSDSGHLSDNVLTTIWSWDVNEPRGSDTLRCASMMRGTGRWQTDDCIQQYRVACRKVDDPNHWVLTGGSYTYDRSLAACPANYVFDVPRVPQQNTILKNVMDVENIDQDRIWINLNLAYNSETCWVVGRYGTCWWSDDAGEEYLGLIKTSIVGGVIVLILVGFFVWVKCARLWRNRNSKSRKAMAKAMLARREYVTVPA